MSGFFVVILLFLLLLVLMGLLIGSVKGPRAVYLTAVTATVSAWFIGLLLDANLDLHPEGFLALRVLLTSPRSSWRPWARSPGRCRWCGTAAAMKSRRRCAF